MALWGWNSLRLIEVMKLLSTLQYLQWGNREMKLEKKLLPQENRVRNQKLFDQIYQDSEYREHT